MKKQVLVVGLGRFGTSVANSLSDVGYDVLAIDSSERQVQAASAQISHVVQADATSEAVLNELGIKEFDVAIIAVGSDIQSSVMATVLLKKLGIPYVVARANNILHGEILKKIGADKVVFPENDMGNRVAHELLLGKVGDYLAVTRRYGLISVEVVPELAGLTLADLDLGPRGKENVAALIIRRGNEVILNPSLSELVKAEDVMILAGTDDGLEAFLGKMSLVKNKGTENKNRK
jgi:trk system potassium uptake protein TrkA